MARIPLGALTTLNTSTHLDPMFVDIYSGAFANFVFSSGRIGIGGSVSASSILKVYGDIELDTTARSIYANTLGAVSSGTPMNLDCGGSNTLIFKRGATETGRFDGSGNFISRPTVAGPTLANNGEMSFRLVSNTSLQIIARGSDGVTRAATLTLS
jgi:hypothetical protein